MDRPFYQFETGGNARVFGFVSSGPRPVEKRLLHAETSLPEFYSLALADVEPDGSLNFYSVRDNGDLAWIMATVAQTLLVFFGHYPRAKVAFTGSTPARTRLYRIILARELPKPAGQFVVSGVRAASLEAFAPNRDYNGFVITLPASTPRTP